MADNEQKNYFEFIDIPDGNGGTERRYARDAEAQAAIQSLTPVEYASVAETTTAMNELT